MLRSKFAIEKPVNIDDYFWIMTGKTITEHGTLLAMKDFLIYWYCSLRRNCSMIPFDDDNYLGNFLFLNSFNFYKYFT